jgi:hypothetical protein
LKVYNYILSNNQNIYSMPEPYKTYADLFTDITGLDPKKFPDTFIQFIQAKRLEEIFNQQLTKMNELIAAVKQRSII